MAATNSKGQAHTGHGTGARFFGSSKVGVGVYIDKSHGFSRRPSRTQEASENDTAIAPQHNGKAAVACGRFHSVAERPGISSDFGFVPGTARWTHVVSIRGRDDIAQIGGAQALHQAKLAQHSRGLIELPGFAAVVGADADARWSADDYNVPVHESPLITIKRCLAGKTA
jgi:hypothetical protein